MVSGSAIAILGYQHSTSKPRMEERITGGGVGRPGALSLDIILADNELYKVYTCQKGQPKRCDFFLWDDEAKSREAAAVLNNSRTEPTMSPQTPSKPSPYTLITPQTSSRLRDGSLEPISPGTPSKISRKTPSSSAHGSEAQAATTQGSDSAEEEFYDWPASDNDELSKFADQASSGHPMPPPQTPRKAIKADLLSTPGKRRYDDMAVDIGDALKVALQIPATGRDGIDILTTPTTHGKGLSASGTLPSPAETPTPIRYKDIPPTQDSELASEVLGALQSHHASITIEARETLSGICNKHVLYTRGIMKGRDLSRAMVKNKDKRIMEMQREIEGLKAERETNRSVIRHLRRDMAVRKGSEN